MAKKTAAAKSALVVLDGEALGVEDVVTVARSAGGVKIGTRAVTAMKRSRAVVERALRDGKPHYGINTGFGSLSKQRINDADLAALQLNLVRSHAAGIGEPLADEVVRAMMLLLAASLSRGLSGVRPMVAETIVAMLNAGITPIVPSLGSVGASGDLAPLAHVALVALGEGRARVGGKEVSGGEALRKAGISPLTLSAKEGLALINGTHLMAGEAALLTHDAAILLDAALLALAMAIDAARASDSFLDARLYEARQHLAAAAVADRVRGLMEGSTIRESHRENDPRVQDPYSLRAAPTVLGACAVAIAGLADTLEAGELGAVTDNPLVFPEDDDGGESIVSGANFHGMPLAIPLDTLAIALCHIAGISERRTYLLTGAFEPESHLKPFLAPRPGLQSGLMIAQYTAAACVNELIGLATPASVANISTSAGMEDYNSFGPRSAAKARRGIELARNVVAIELLCAAQGIEYHRPHTSGKKVERAHAAIRKVVKPLTEDRPPTADIQAVSAMIAAGAFSLD